MRSFIPVLWRYTPGIGTFVSYTYTRVLCPALILHFSRLSLRTAWSHSRFWFKSFIVLRFNFRAVAPRWTVEPSQRHVRARNVAPYAPRCAPCKMWCRRCHYHGCVHLACALQHALWSRPHCRLAQSKHAKVQQQAPRTAPSGAWRAWWATIKEAIVGVHMIFPISENWATN